MGPTNQSYVLVCLSLVSLTYSDVVDFIVCPSDNLLFSVGERIMGLYTEKILLYRLVERISSLLQTFDVY